MDSPARQLAGGQAPARAATVRRLVWPQCSPALVQRLSHYDRRPSAPLWDGHRSVAVDGVQIRIPEDGLHLSPHGVELVTHWLGSQLAALRRVELRR